MKINTEDHTMGASPWLSGKESAQIQYLGREDPLEKGTAIHSSIRAWEIPWIEETGGLQFMGSQRVGHN